MGRSLWPHSYLSIFIEHRYSLLTVRLFSLPCHVDGQFFINLLSILPPSNALASHTLHPLSFYILPSSPFILIYSYSTLLTTFLHLFFNTPILPSFIPYPSILPSFYPFSLYTPILLFSHPSFLYFSILLSSLPLSLIRHDSPGAGRLVS